ncbi:hypothetical protein ACMXYN_08935 [Neptuniibacter sp. PT8_73]|uniref:hypothetical protein n=1 Tax=Neptuniibacter sp. PT8_73 TaxID=3398206 RepID=UPI0039F53D97
MAKHWTETAPFPSLTLDIGSLQGLPDVEGNVRVVYFIEVCRFTFQFYSVEQIQAAMEWFEEKVHKSTRMKDEPFLRAERDILQRWHERLPAHIKKGSKRERIVKAFRSAIQEYS